ncbi:MAG: GIY-YIG nuclease family protein [Desulfosarcina sp.]|jgi:Uri superfamily endonuclease
MIVDHRSGTYALLFHCHRSFQAEVGKLGQIEVGSGYWIYVGSAFGPGGLLSRVARHLKPTIRPHWHVDYIKARLRPLEIWATSDTVKREHVWARVLSEWRDASQPIAAFGATDCTCRSHLIHRQQRPDFFSFKARLYRRIPTHGPLVRALPTDVRDQ